MQSLMPKDDEPIKPIQPPQPQQQAPQAGPQTGYPNYPPPNYPPPNYPNYPPPNYAPQRPPPNYAQPPVSGSNLKTTVLMGAVIALVGACGYLFYQLNEVKTQIGETKEALLTEIEKIHETSSVTVKRPASVTSTNCKRISALARAHKPLPGLSGEAKAEANKHADEINAKLEKAQAEQGQKVAAMGAEGQGCERSSIRHLHQSGRSYH